MENNTNPQQPNQQQQAQPQAQPNQQLQLNIENITDEELMLLLISYVYSEAGKSGQELLSRLDPNFVVVKSSNSPEIKASIENAKKFMSSVSSIEDKAKINEKDPLEPVNVENPTEQEQAEEEPQEEI